MKNLLRKIFSKEKEIPPYEELHNINGRKSVHFKEFENSNFFLSVLGYTPSTGKILVKIKKEGIDVGSGITRYQEDSTLTISNMHGKLGFTGNIYDINLYYGSTPADALKPIPLKRFLDERFVQYTSSPSLERLKEKLDEYTDNIIRELRS